jgi:hypothetical protein
MKPPRSCYPDHLPRCGYRLRYKWDTRDVSDISTQERSELATYFDFVARKTGQRIGNDYLIQILRIFRIASY